MSGEHIYVVEDEAKIAQLLVDYLEQDGFHVKVINDGTNAVALIRDAQPSFIILDLMLPGKDGLTICKEIRQFSEVPIMMLTARVDEIDRLLGLELGADDYVCKPFSPREVVIRTRSILRRVQRGSTNNTDNNLQYRGVRMHLSRMECQVNQQILDLTPIEFRLLKGLMAQPGWVYSRNQIMRMVYDDSRVVSDRTIDSHVKNLRKKLAAAMPEEELIHSIYGLGFKLE